MTTDLRAGYRARVQETLRTLREAHPDWSDTVIAARLGITKSAVGQWKLGKTLPSPQQMYPLADLARVSPRWLAMGVGDKAAAKRATTLPADVLALAEKIASLPPDVLATLRRAFSEPVSDERVEVFYPPAPHAAKKKKV